MDYIKNYKKQITGSILLLLILGVSVFIFLHGNIEIKGSQIKEVTYSRVNQINSENLNINNGHSLLQSGDYFIKAVSNNNTSYIKMVSVPHFMQKIVVEPTAKEYDLKMISQKSHSFAGPINDDLVLAFDYNSSIEMNNINEFDHQETNNTIPPYSNFTYLSSSLLAGYIQSDNTITPVVYNLISNESTYYPSLEISSNSEPVGLSMINSSSFLTSTNSTGITLYDTKNTVKQPYKQLKLNNYDIASFDTNQLISSSKDAIAVLEGPRQSLSSDGDISKPNTNFTIHTLDINGKQNKSTKISRQLIKSVDISKNGEFLAITTESSLEIFDINSQKIIYTLPLTAEGVLWRDDNHIILISSDDRAVYQINIKEKIATTLFAGGIINASQLSYIENNVLFFSGYSLKDKFSTRPNLYKVDVTKDTSNSQVMKKLPYQGDGYYIDSINNHIYITLTRYISIDNVSYDEKARVDAYKYISDNLAINDDYTVNESYVDMDLR